MEKKMENEMETGLYRGSYHAKRSSKILRSLAFWRSAMFFPELVAKLLVRYEDSKTKAEEWI